MIRFFRLAFLVMLGFVVTGCATALVSSHVRRDVRFDGYRTFDWGPADALPTGDPRLDRNPFFKDYLQGAVERQLAAKGIELAATGSPDLLIHYHANVKRRFDVNRVHQGGDSCVTAPCITITDYEAGTIVLDIIETHSNRLLWRGWAQDDLEALLGNQRGMRKVVEQAVEKMFRTLPIA